MEDSWVIEKLLRFGVSVATVYLELGTTFKFLREIFIEMVYARDIFVEMTAAGLILVLFYLNSYHPNLDIFFSILNEMPLIPCHSRLSLQMSTHSNPKDSRTSNSAHVNLNQITKLCIQCNYVFDAHVMNAEQQVWFVMRLVMHL